MPLSMRFAGRGRNVGALVRPPNRPRSLCSCRFRRGATISFWAHRDDVLASHLLTDPPGGPTGGRLRTGRPGGLGDGQGAGRRGWLAFACPPKRSPVRLTRSLFAPPCPREPCVQAVLGLGGAVVAPLPHPLSGRDPCVQARFPLAQSIPFLGAGKTRAAFSHTANHPLGGLTGPAVCALAGSSRWRVERCSWRNRAPSTDLRALCAPSVPRKACVYAGSGLGAHCVRPCAPPQSAAIPVFMRFPPGRKDLPFGRIGTTCGVYAEDHSRSGASEGRPGSIPYRPASARHGRGFRTCSRPATGPTRGCSRTGPVRPGE
jgi:hypothetical protein